MRKNVLGRRFKRDTNERKALFKSLLSALIINGRITTTQKKARAIRARAEKIITRAKNKGNKDVLFRRYLVQEAIDKLAETAPLFSKTQGGYTRIIKIGNRLADNAPQAIIELTKQIVKPEKIEKTEEKPAKKEKEAAEKTKAEVKKSKTTKKAVKK